MLASAGIGSRRACEELIAQGRVRVDGKPVREQGMRIDPARQIVEVDGMRVNVAPDLVYLILNKPAGVVSTMSDERGRPSIADLLGERRERLFHVGRLDADSEGLLLLTNDGELANRLMHPAYGVPKTYLAEVAGSVRPAALRALRAGVELEDGPAKADEVRVTGSTEGRTLIELVVHEGRKHIVRRMLAEVGHPVLRLVRTRIGPVRLGELKPGRTRHLSQREIGELYRESGGSAPAL